MKHTCGRYTASSPTGCAIAAPTVAGPEERITVSAEIAEALAQLGERDREVLALRFGGDLNGPEIAELLGLSLAKVQQITSRSLRKLRELLEPERSALSPRGLGTGARRTVQDDPPIHLFFLWLKA